MSVVIDANLLCLLVVGAVDPSAIGTHSRLRAFSIEDYANLQAIIDRKGTPILCPQVLSETSNLVAYRQPPSQLSRFRRGLAMFVHMYDELSINARKIVLDEAYGRLGLTDAMLLILSAENGYSLLSDDLHLCLASEQRGHSTINYNYVRDGALRIADL